MPKTYRDKLKSRTIPSVFIGYSPSKKGYKLLTLSNFSIFFSRDVIFHEHVFPYSAPSSSHLFPPSVPSVSPTVSFPHMSPDHSNTSLDS